MKLTHKIMIGIFFLIVLSMPATASMIVNDTFEDNNASRWTQSGTGTLVINSTAPISGLYSGWYNQLVNAQYVFKNFSSQSSNFTINFQLNQTSAKPQFFASDCSSHGYTNSHYIVCNTGQWAFYNDSAYQNIGLACSSGNSYNFSITFHTFGVVSKADYVINGVGYNNVSSDRGSVDEICSFAFSSYLAGGGDMFDNICICSGTQNTTCCDAGAPGSPTYFSITARDIYNNSYSLSNFSAVVNGTSYNTTNGTIITGILQNASVFVDVNMSSNEGYFNESFSRNVSSNFLASLSQSIITFQGVEMFTGSGVNNFSVNTSLHDNSTTTGSMIFRFRAGSYTINITPTGNYSPAYYSFEQNISVSPLDNLTINLTFFNANFTLFVKEINTNNTITNYNLTIISNDYSYNAVFSGQNNSTTMNLMNGSYNFSINAGSIYAIQNETLSIENGTNNQTIFLYSANSLWVHARDEDGGSPISNFTVMIYSTTDNYENDSNVNTSIAYFGNVSAGIYTARVQSSGYGTRYQNITMTSGAHVDLTVYLSQVAGNSTLVFKDKYTSETIEGVSYAMYRLINGSWQVISSGLSDITGRVFFTFAPDTSYNFVCTKSGFVPKNFSLTPHYSSYDVQLIPIYQGEGDIQFGSITAQLQGIPPLNNKNNFITLFIASPYGTLQGYGLNLTYGATTVSGSGANAIGGTVALNITISGAGLNDFMVATYYFNESNGNYREFSEMFALGNATAGNGTMEGLRDEKFGMGALELLIIAFGITLVLAGFGAVIGGSAGAGLIGIASMSFFTYMGFVPLYAFLPFALVGIVLLISSFRGGY